MLTFIYDLLVTEQTGSGYETQIETPQDRLDYIKTIYGDAPYMIGLAELLAVPLKKKKHAFVETTRLLIVKTTELMHTG
jgi:hypothetical protein